MEKLEIDNAQELRYLWQTGIRLLQNLCSLNRFRIKSCPPLFSWVAEEDHDRTQQQGLTCRLQYFDLVEYQGIVKLPQALLNICSLREIQISKCNSLVSFPEATLPSQSKTITIMFCNALESLPEAWMRDTKPSLGSLQIFQCNSLTYIARIELPTSLKRLKVSNCNNLRILTEEEDINSRCNRHTSHLESLEIEDCASLASLLWKNKLSATLERLAVKRCPNLAFLSLSDNLPKALKYLSLHGFSKLESIAERLENTSLEEISIWSCENLKMIPDDLHKLQNLPRFSLGFCNNLISFPRGGLPSTKLNKVDINGNQKLEALPNGMYNLTSLQRLNLGYLPSVVSFPGDGFPANIDSLVIRDMKICRALFEGGCTDSPPSNGSTSLEDVQMWCRFRKRR